MRAPRHAWRFFAFAALLALAGCFRLSRDAPRVKYFVLSGAATAASSRPPSTPDTAGIALGLRRLDLASYLSRPAIVMRRGANEIVVSDFHRWGEELAEGINRVVAAHLASEPLVRVVDVAPWAARARHDYLVQLHVFRFEGATDSAATEGRSHLTAGWDIIRPVDGRVLVRGSTDAFGAPWRIGDYAALVSGLDAALSSMARDIRGCLSRIPNDSTPPARCESGAGDQRQGAIH